MSGKRVLADAAAAGALIRDLLCTGASHADAAGSVARCVLESSPTSALL